MTLDFTQDELNALGTLLNAGVKFMGLESARTAVMFLDKVEAAAKSKNQAPANADPKTDPAS